MGSLRVFLKQLVLVSGFEKAVIMHGTLMKTVLCTGLFFSECCVLGERLVLILGQLILFLT